MDSYKFRIKSTVNKIRGASDMEQNKHHRVYLHSFKRIIFNYNEHQVLNV